VSALSRPSPRLPVSPLRHADKNVQNGRLVRARVALAAGEDCR